jgi:TolB protein
MTANRPKPTAVLLASMLPAVLAIGPGTVGDPHVRPDGSSAVYAPVGRSSAQNPAFSPDGTSILFTRFRRGYDRGPAGLFTIARSAERPRRLLFEHDFDSVNLPGAAWSATAGRIAFASDRSGGAEEIWTVRPDGSGLRRVTRHATRTRFAEPSFSPDGRSIVFQVDRPGRRGDSTIWRVPADGGHPVRLTTSRRSLDDREPNWSPRGDLIVFQRRNKRRDDWDLWTMAPDGAGQRHVTRGPSDDTDPSFSPNGTRIVYSSNRGGLSAANLFVVSAAGGAPVRVTRDRRYAGAPSWSPDSRWIAFESSARGGDERPTAIWRIRVPVLL